MTTGRGSVLAAIAALGLAVGAAQAQEDGPQVDEPQVDLVTPTSELIEFWQPATAPWGLVPDRLTLRGSLVDDRGAPVAGAEVHAEIAGLRAVTDGDGHFALPDVVTPDDRITLTHPDYVTLSLEARALYAGTGGEAFIRTAKYRETFDIGPEGGIYRGDALVLEVPRGAVFGRLTLRAARLPPVLALDPSTGLQGERVATLALEPAGLVFRQPIRLRLPLPTDRRGARALRVMTLDARADAESAPNFGANFEAEFGTDAGEGRFVPDPNASLIADASMAILSVDHLGRFAFVDPDAAVSRQRLARTFDVNGDGKLTTEDASLVAILSGPGQAIEWPLDRQAGGRVMALPKDPAEPPSSIPTGLTIAGVGLPVDSALGRRQAAPIMAKLGLAAAPPAAYAMALEAPGEDGKCLYVLRWYDYWRSATWRRHRVSGSEHDRLRAALDAPHQGQDQPEWRYFRVEGVTPVAPETTLYSGDRIAVRGEDGELAVYLQTGDYMVRAPVGAATRACGAGNLRDRAGRDKGAEQRLEDFSFFGGGEGLAQAIFVANGDGYRSFRYGGWGILPEGSPERFRGLGCGVTLAGQLSPRAGVAALSDRARQTLPPLSLALSLPASAEGDYDFGASQGSMTAARAYAASFLGEIGAGVEWTLGAARARADHLLFRLGLVLTSRDWQVLAREEVPRALRARLAAGVTWTDGWVFASVGDQIYMAATDGSWYRGSHPLAVSREIGLLLLSDEPRACEATEAPEGVIAAPLEDPRMVSFKGPEDARIRVGRTADGHIVTEAETEAGTTRTLFDSAGRVREVTNEAGEVTRIDYDDDGEVIAVTDITGATVLPVSTDAPGPGPADDFAAPRVPDPPGPPVDIPADAMVIPLAGLDGTTLLNRTHSGALESLQLIDDEGRAMSLANAGASIEESEQEIRLEIANPEGLAGMLLHAANGVYHLIGGAQALPPPGFLWPLDGMIDIANGRVRETLALPQGLIDIDATLAAHRVTLARQPVDIMVLRPREVAVAGDRVLAPEGRRATIAVEGPAGAKASAEVPAWGYRILVQPVTNPNLSVPIRIKVSGLAPGEKVMVRFYPSEFQTVEPTKVILSGGPARTPVPIAQFTTTRIGSQDINVTVEKLP